MLDFDKFRWEIIEFMSKETLEAIDWGVLDLGHIRDCELRKILLAMEAALTLELERNYRYNSTGIFRVSVKGRFWCYEENGIEIKAKSIGDLKRLVESQDRIWYVFDEELGGNCVKLKGIS